MKRHYFTGLLSALLLCTLSVYDRPAQSNPSQPLALPEVKAVEPRMVAPAVKGESLNQIKLSAKTATFKHSTHPREAKVRYPIVTGVSDPTFQAKLQTAIDLKTVFGRSLEEMEQDFQETHWLRQLDYTVNYNDRGILSLTYSGDGLAAYPSGFVRYQSVNLQTGDILRPHHLFKTSSLGSIARMVDRQLQKAIQTKVAELDRDENAKEIDRAIFRAHQFRIRHLNDFTVTSEGVMFHYRFGFPHVILAAEPEGDFLIPYAELKPHLKVGSLLQE